MYLASLSIIEDNLDGGGKARRLAMREHSLENAARNMRALMTTSSTRSPCANFLSRYFLTNLALGLRGSFTLTYRANANANIHLVSLLFSSPEARRYCSRWCEQSRYISSHVEITVVITAAYGVPYFHVHKLCPSRHSCVYIFTPLSLFLFYNVIKYFRVSLWESLFFFSFSERLELFLW